MSSVMEKRLPEVGYFLSRLGVNTPPSQLEVNSWKEAYAKFYVRFSRDKLENELKTSFKISVITMSFT